MNFDRLKQVECIIQPDAPLDPRCLSSEFALANPSICGNVSALILKPAIALLCEFESVTFRVFEFKDGIETELFSGVEFTSSDSTILAIGVNSGNATGIAAGNAVVTATYNTRTVTSKITVYASSTCCDDISVISSIVLDNSLSQSLPFGAGYNTKLDFGRAVAEYYGGLIVEVDGTPKDSHKVWSLDTTPTDQLESYSDDATEVLAAIALIQQGDNKTNLLPAFETIGAELLEETGTRKVLLLISDGEQTENSDRQSIIDAAADFRNAGGIIMVVGVRASGSGYDLLERIATGGFFINCFEGIAASAFDVINYLKSLLCGADCYPPGDIFINQAQLNYSSFAEFEVVEGIVNLLGADDDAGSNYSAETTMLNLLPDNGLYVELCGGTPATIRTIDSFTLVAGRDYEINFRIAGNQREDISGMAVKVYARAADAVSTDPNVFEAVVAPTWNQGFQKYSFVFNATCNASVKIYFKQLYSGDAPIIGNLIDDIELMDRSTHQYLLRENFDSENTVYLPPRCGGSAAVAAIDDPLKPYTTPVYDSGTPAAAETYRYGITYVTEIGETAVALQDGPYLSSATDDFAIQVNIPLPPASIIDRVAEIRVWRSVSTAAAPYHLLATVTSRTSVYIDTTRAADFDYEVSVTAPTENTTASAEGDLGYGAGVCCGYYYDYYDMCEDCSIGTPGAQLPDPDPLANIETDVYEAPVIFTSGEVTKCASCVSGQINLSTDSFTISELTSSSLGPPIVCVVKLSTQGLVRHYTLGPYSSGFAPHDWTLHGSMDGTTWTLLDTRVGIQWFGAEKMFPLLKNTGSYLYYKLTVTDSDNDSVLVEPFELFNVDSFHPEAEAEVCKSASDTSTVNPLDAYTKAAAEAQQDALDALNCVPIYTSTIQYRARCAVGTYGQTIIKSATVYSLNGQLEADLAALYLAKTEAEAELDCTDSSNDQKITINDAPATGPAPATPYPSVKYVSGETGTITQVVVELTKFTHSNPDDVDVLLVSPAGTAVVIMSGCGGSIAVQNITLTIYDAAGVPLPDATALTEGDYQPADYNSDTFLSCAPSGPYGIALSDFNGEDANGAWQLWVLDRTAGSSGYIQGWDLTIVTA